MLRRKLPLLGSVFITFIAINLVQPFSHFRTLAQHDNSCRTFVETGKTVCGKFLAYWQSRGGLEQFGFPISNPFREVSELNGREYMVQYFERAVFEMHPENTPPHDVQLSQLGIYRFKSKYPDGELEAPYVENLPLYPNARNVKVVDFDIAVPDQAVIKTVTFETNDRPEAVRTFYTDVMVKNGWQQIPPRGSESLNFVFVAAGPVYGLGIEIKASNATTVVSLSLRKTLPK